jgi:hypothetical protein
MHSALDLPTIIREGKLKSYTIDLSFLRVYWQHPNLETGSYYVFTFTTMELSLVGVTKVVTSQLPVKHRSREVVPIIHQAMGELLV